MTRESPASRGTSLSIERPRLLARHRQSAGAITVGDEAIVQTAPGLIAFLGLRDSAGEQLGAGFSPPWTVPLGAAASALDAAVGPPAPGSISWTTWSYSVTWFRGAAENETIQAFCRVTGVTPQFVRYSLRAVGMENETDLLAAEGVSSASPVQLVSPDPPPEADEAPPVSIFSGFASSALSGLEGGPPEPRTILLETRAPEPVGSALSSPVRVGDSSEWRVSSGLLELLMHPLQGRSEPLGRRSHPYSGIQIGAAIYAARRLLGGRYEPESAGVRHLRSFREPRGDCTITLGVSAVSASGCQFDCRFLRFGEVMSAITLQMSQRSAADDS